MKDVVENHDVVEPSGVAKKLTPRRRRRTLGWQHLPPPIVIVLLGVVVTIIGRYFS